MRSPPAPFLIDDDDGGNEKYGYRPQDGRALLKDHLNVLHAKEGVSWATDDVTGELLDPALVQEARRTEMKYFNDMNVYVKVPREHQVKTGGKIIKTKWIDINKGDRGKPLYRCRLVGKEFKTFRDDILYYSTPP